MFDAQDLSVPGVGPASQPALMPATAATPVHLLDRLNAVFKHRRLAGTAFALVVAVMMVQTYSTVPTFESRARIQIEDEKVTNLANLQDTNPILYNQDPAEYKKTQVSILTSRGLALRVVKRLDLAHQPLFSGGAGPRPHDPMTLVRDARASASKWVRSLVSKPAPKLNIPERSPVASESAQDSGLVSAFLGGVSVQAETDTRLVWIVYHHSNPDFAATAANTLAEEYMSQNLEVRRQNVNKLHEFVTTELDKQRVMLEEADRKLANYRETNNAISLDSRSDIQSAQLNTLNAQLLSKREVRAQKEAAYNQIRGANPEDDAADSFAVIGTAKTVVDAENSLRAAGTARDQIKAKGFGEAYAPLKQAEVQVDNARRSVIAARRQIMQQIKNEYDAAAAEERNTAGGLEQAKAAQTDLSRKGVDYGELERNRDKINLVYTQLAQQQQQLSVLEQSSENNVRIIDRAEPQRFPIAPNPRKEWLSAIMAGLVVAFGLAFGIEYLDDTVKTPEDITRRLKVPLLGLVPAIRGDRVPVLTETVPHDFGEAFRSLRTSLVFTSGSEHTRVIAVTSSQPLEGKTTTAANLALALALGGSRVLLIDADMRRPGLHKTLGIHNETGLSHLLTGQARVRDAIQRTPEPNLLVITAGRTPPNPSELLASERMRSFVLNLGTGPFDWVVIDTPPVLAVTDAVIIAPIVSGVVFVIGSEMTRRVHSERALETLRGSRPRALTAVLNRVDFDRNKYYYSRYYGYQYKSYYGQQSQGAA